MLQSTHKKKTYLEGHALLEALVAEFEQIVPPMFDNELVVELAWDYGLSPAVIQNAYIQFLDGVS